MAILKHVTRLYIDYLIKRKATGNLENFASKNGVCKRSMTDIINEMKELGFLPGEPFTGVTGAATLALRLHACKHYHKGVSKKHPGYLKVIVL